MDSMMGAKHSHKEVEKRWEDDPLKNSVSFS